MSTPTKEERERALIILNSFEQTIEERKKQLASIAEYYYNNQQQIFKDIDKRFVEQISNIENELKEMDIQIAKLYEKHNRIECRREERKNKQWYCIEDVE